MKRFTQEQLETVGFERVDETTMRKKYHIDPTNPRPCSDYGWTTFVKCEDTQEDVFESYGNFLIPPAFKTGYGEKEIEGFRRIFEEYAEDMRKLGFGRD